MRELPRLDFADVPGEHPHRAARRLGREGHGARGINMLRTTPNFRAAARFCAVGGLHCRNVLDRMNLSSYRPSPEGILHHDKTGGLFWVRKFDFLVCKLCRLGCFFSFLFFFTFFAVFLGPKSGVRNVHAKNEMTIIVLVIVLGSKRSCLGRRMFTSIRNTFGIQGTSIIRMIERDITNESRLRAALFFLGKNEKDEAARRRLRREKFFSGNSDRCRELHQVRFAPR